MSKAAVPEWVESRFPLYAFGSIQSLYGSAKLPLEESSAVLVSIAGGKGVFKAGDRSGEIAEGSVILLPPGSEAALIADRLQPLHAYSLSIGFREQKRPAGEMMRKSGIASNSELHFFPYEPEMAALVEELYVHRSPESEGRHVRNQIIFHELVLGLAELLESKEAASLQPSMERSLAYLENKFSDKMTRDALAEIAGVSPSHYSILFKQLTGFSFNDYLSRLRVHRAKELLLSGSGTLREIALKVGYKDEFYFSRRFKQQTGMPPSAYNRMPFRRVAVMMTPYASHLLLLGLEPSVLISDNSEYVNAEGVQPPQDMTFIHADSPVEQVRPALLAHDIELILADSRHLDEHGLHAAQLRVAAPIAEIPWMGVGWKEHLRLIAQVIKRTGQAERWLAEFEEEELAARARIQHSGAAGGTVTIVVIKPDQLLIYGARNVGYVLYGSLGLQPPAKIKQEMDRLGEQFHSIPIEIPQLADYAGDRVLVIVFPDVKGSTAHSEAVLGSTYWGELSAVRRNDIHFLEKDDWVPYNPVSIRLQLQRAEALFGGNQ
ncbi:MULTISPECIES: helix-turn-helix domain-containing protein [unclassified Paenibacillus]|uniref:helix-turn-helix domain-containing protein n=1 Tax=unclassified Paenibacillus TaxID=185978 RepID=UPI000957115B|nr:MULTISPECIES: helix-turn-helix domain-containing protein [unclassified Paenibacillus]ASS68533.1 AraC family transcriptional regulator [Paenibacillus sp. RUD330]SIR62899.1 substrate-binding protein [Paenibacillus sp. RU4X]SIR71386.1 substrate-binding protein [Paenibacillus sp. RU4T]